ncbi:MAG: sulfatase-like hydrolase/transferase, partial [Anaerolineae bacterium]
MKNILFLLADCLRADLVFGENRRAPTPAINRLKKWGLSFTQVISSATMTSPCVSALMTGCYPHVTGIHQLRGDTLNPALPTLAELLQAKGYRTGALVTGPLWEGLGIERGFEHFEYRKPSPQLSASWRDRIREWSTPGEDARPWFLYAHFFDLHAPRVVAPEFDRSEFGPTIYERAVASLDRRFAEIFGALDWKNTIVVLHADHGEAYPETAWLEFREKMWQDVL